jgi:hypothetical protein
MRAMMAEGEERHARKRKICRMNQKQTAVGIAGSRLQVPLDVQETAGGRTDTCVRFFSCCCNNTFSIPGTHARTNQHTAPLSSDVREVLIVNHDTISIAY